MQQRRIDPEGKRQAVVAAARALFVEKGYHNVTIPQIVRRSGVSTGAIYHYFGNKEGIARFLREQTLADFQRLLAERQAEGQTIRAQLRAFAEVVFTIAEQDPEMMRYMLFMRHAEFLSEAPPICATGPFRDILLTMERGIAAGELHGCSSQSAMVAAITFTGVILRAVELRLEGVLTSPLDQIADALFANAWRAVHVP